MEKEFIPYTQALALKELGFDKILCYGFYFGTEDLVNVVTNIQHKTKNKCLAPLYQQAFKWFRDKYQIECHIKSLYEQKENKGFYFGLDDYKSRDFYSKTYVSYEEAELECLKKLIEIVKNK